MSWKRRAGPIRPPADGATMLLRGPISVGLVLAAAVLAVLLAPSIPVAQSNRIATSEKMTPARLKSFHEEHSWLDYTTRGGETLQDVAKTLRVGEPNRIREENEQLAEIADDQPLAADLVLRVRYNRLENERPYEQQEN